MSVENTQVIDLIGFEESTGKVILTIADHLPWDDSEHLPLLQKKLISYLAFIESGEIYESYPRARRPNFGQSRSRESDITL